MALYGQKTKKVTSSQDDSRSEESRPIMHARWRSTASHAWCSHVVGRTTGIPTRISTAIGLLDRCAGRNFQRLKAARAA